MRMMRGLIPIIVLILSSLACFATAEEEDDSSVPMCDSRCTPVNIPMPGGFLSSITPGPTPALFLHPTFPPVQPIPIDGVPTTGPESFGPSTAPGPTDRTGGISTGVYLGGVLVLAFGGFGVVVARTKKSKQK